MVKGPFMSIEEKKDSAEKIKRLAEFKAILEKKIQAETLNLEGLKTLLEFVDSMLLERGFQRAKFSKVRNKKERAASTTSRAVFPLKSLSGELLANLHVSQNSMKITPAKDKMFNVKTPPFQQFLIERVLSKMQEKDSKASQKGEMEADKTLSYELSLEGDILQEIIVKNITAERLRELKSSVHWTLEKMYEKTKNRR
ncbi:MAG: hypothetical protein JSV05_00545 [Candidatus Bathyarchaeota archaeon]|nr:MAG: hypothetical protein JSV05_00545 [Candidatus Bathyarchaeota archaeon]